MCYEDAFHDVLATVNMELINIWKLSGDSRNICLQH